MSKSPPLFLGEPRLIEQGQFNNLKQVWLPRETPRKDWNCVPLDEACGLSPWQMHRFLYHPFSPETPVRYNTDLQDFPKAPFFQLLGVLMEGISGGGLKATVKGNLPRNFCLTAAESFYGKSEKLSSHFGSELTSEVIWDELHTVRLTAGMAGLLRKTGGRFRMTRKGEKFLCAGMDGKLFLDLFRAYTWKFHWAYRDLYPEMDMVQTSFLVTLFFLQKFGDRARPVKFYEDLFVKIFPETMSEVPQNQYFTPEQETRHCYSTRALRRFAAFFGFAELIETATSFEIPKAIKKNPFLDYWITFES